MQLVYSFLNFAILAAVLCFAGRRTAKRLIQKHKDEVSSGLQAAQEGRNQAEQTQQLLAQQKQEYMQRSSEIAGRIDDIHTREQLACRQMSDRARQQAAERLAEDHRHYTDSMIGRVQKSYLAKLAGEAEKLFSQEPYVSRFRAQEPQIVDEILRHAATSPGDVVYLLKHDVLYVTVTSAFELAPELVEKLRSATDRLLEQLGGKSSFWVRVDQSLIGGLRLRIGDTVFDSTVANYLYRLSHADSLDPGCEADHYEAAMGSLRRYIQGLSNEIDEYQLGRVLSVSDGICYMDGLADIMYGELVEFNCGETGMVLDIEDSRIACVVFGSYEKLQEGERVRRIGRVMSVPVGEAYLGRVVNAMGQPIDGRGEIHASGYRPIECAAPAILDRKSVNEPLETGLVAIDALVPIGKGQRELIIGDRQSGKTAIAVDTILNQKGKNVICIYVAIGQKETTVAGIRDTLKKYDALSYTIILSADANDSAPMQYIAPYSGAAMGEYFMYQGRDVLIVYDDLSKHAVAYRELSLLLHRPSGREAYPGDVFYLHSRLLERSARLSDEAGGGSMTALPIIETQAGDISAYIPTNVISITDGQIFLDADLFHEGVRPAVNVGLSVSRVGGAAQTGAMKQVAGQLRMNLAQYRELQSFSQFGSDLDASTKATLALGDRMTAVLKQPRYEPLPINEQVLIIFAVSNGYADNIALEDMVAFESALLSCFETDCPELLNQISGKMSAELQQQLREQIAAFCSRWKSGDAA